MIPLRDSVRPKSFPVVSVSIIIINVIIFLLQLTLQRYQLNQLFYIFGIVPAETLNSLFVNLSLLPAVIPFFTSMFMHGGWLHIISNMLYLWIFGDNIEDRLGHFNFLFFYLGTGIIAGLAHVIINPASTVPVIGASGAIAGVLGGYFLLFPRSRILSLVPIFFFLTVLEVPAVIFIAIWFLMQLFSGVASLGGTAGTVAWWAHIGGFMAGALIVKLLGLSSQRQKALT
ncbi:MAG: rhomboid family intramembrane serine protease [Clostridiales bacterium]|nr:rhomboid family intramembrane serine protease [Clostridiales bacterium]MCF8022980.1 rhomboid family intramembrane serine protease [Clostridiales bacterium]